MFIIVSREMPNIHGRMDRRPITVFSEIDGARRFMTVLAANRIYARLEVNTCS